MILDALANNPNAVVVSDRGPLSNAVTAGFCLAQSRLSPSEVKRFVDEVIGSVDAEFMDYLDPEHLLCTRPLGSNGVGHREQLDLLETHTPQAYAEAVYAMLNIPTIQTATPTGWCNSNELVAEAMNHFGLPYTEQTEQVSWEVALARRALTLIGPHLVLTAESFLQAPSTEVARVLEIWKLVSLLPEDELKRRGLLQPEQDRKVALDGIESRLAGEIKWRVSTSCANLNLRPEARAGLNRLFQAYPEIPESIVPLAETSGIASFPYWLRELARLEV